MFRLPPRLCTPSRVLAIAAACALLASCASSATTQSAGTRACDDTALGWAVGTRFDEDIYRRLLSESGAGLVNPIGPNNLTRRDSRTDRLRVYLDKDNRIASVRCE